MESIKISNCECICSCCKKESDKPCYCQKENDKMICTRECCNQHKNCCDLDIKLKEKGCLHDYCNQEPKYCGQVNSCCKIQGDKFGII